MTFCDPLKVTLMTYSYPKGISGVKVTPSGHAITASRVVPLEHWRRIRRRMLRPWIGVLKAGTTAGVYIQMGHVPLLERLLLRVMQTVSEELRGQPSTSITDTHTYPVLNLQGRRQAH